LPTKHEKNDKNKYNNTNQEKKREEMRRDGIVGVCRSDASLIPNSENCK
jgi:hypothetical protein